MYRKLWVSGSYILERSRLIKISFKPGENNLLPQRISFFSPGWKGPFLWVSVTKTRTWTEMSRWVCTVWGMNYRSHMVTGGNQLSPWIPRYLPTCREKEGDGN